ncbi:Wzy polymerase domain-containing protein [Pseudomonas sp.]|uniref:PglL family O-oligosaccharyltransferase n=1 Tax=Pseudomonas sp. TaxID=306 RepID=UPI003A97C520
MTGALGYRRVPLMFALLCLMLAWLLPNHYRPWVSAYQDFLAFGAVVLGSFSLVLSRKTVVPAEALFFVLIALVPVAQYFIGTIYFFGDAVLPAVYLLGFSLAMITGFNVYSVGRWNVVLEWFAGACILVSVLSGSIALAQWLSLVNTIWIADLPPGARPFANMAQPNNLASLLFMGLFGVHYFYEKYLLGRFCSGVLTLFILFCIALTGSRTSWVVALSALTFVGLVSMRLPARLPIKTVLLWVAIYFLLVVTVPSLSKALYIDSYNLMQRAMASDRLGLWLQMLQAIKLSPMLGYGWSQVSLAQVSVAVAYPLQLMTEHSHNIVLDFLIWNGPVLGLIFVSVTAFRLVQLVFRVGSVEVVFIVLCLLALLVHGMLEFPLEYAFFLVPLGFLLGGLISEQGGALRLSLPRPVVVAMVVTACLVLHMFWREYRVVAEDYRLMRFETAKIGTLKATEPAPDVVLLSQLREFTRFARTQPTAEMSGADLEWMRKVSHRYPYYLALHRYALALALNGHVEAAREQMLILRGLYGEKVYKHALALTQFEHPELVEALKL